LGNLIPTTVADFLDQIRERSAIDYAGNRLPHTAPKPKEMALAMKLAFLRSRLADAVDRCDRPIDIPHDFADRDRFGSASQLVSAFGAASRLHEPAALKPIENDL